MGENTFFSSFKNVLCSKWHVRYFHIFYRPPLDTYAGEQLIDQGTYVVQAWQAGEDRVLKRATNLLIDQKRGQS